jgi:O-antigen ligase
MLLGVNAVACLLMAIARSEVRRPNSKIGWGLLAFLGWSGISLATSVYRHDSLIELSRLAACFLWFWMARRLLMTPDESTLRARLVWLGGAIVAGAVLVCSIALVSYLQEPTRQFSVFINPNLFANYCAVALPLSLAWTLEFWRSARDGIVRVPAAPALVVGLIASLLILAGLLVTYSKGGLLSALLGGLVFAMAVMRARASSISKVLRTRRKVVAASAILLALLGGGLFAKTVLPRLMQARGTQDNSTMFRVYTWRGTVQMAQARPLLGWGPGTFPSAYNRFAIVGSTSHAHQSWLQIAAEQGAPALLLLLGTCGVAAVRGWKQLESQHWPLVAGGLGALLAMLAHGCTDSGWYVSSITLLLVVTLAVLDTNYQAHTGPPSDSSPITHHSSLEYGWLAWTLVFAFASSQLQRAVTAQNLWSEAQAFLRRGAGQAVAERAQRAVEADPLSAPMWILNAQTASSLEQAQTATQKATELQPARAVNWLWRARLSQTQNPAAAEKFWQEAIARDPNNSSLRLERANWLLERNDSRGWEDLEYVAALAEQPYGKYRPVEEIVNLDFARAYVKLTPRVLEKKQYDVARRYIQRALQDVAEARRWESRLRELAAAAPAGGPRLGPAEDLSELESQLQTLQQQLPKS